MWPFPKKSAPGPIVKTELTPAQLEANRLKYYGVTITTQLKSGNQLRREGVVSGYDPENAREYLATQLGLDRERRTFIQAGPDTYVRSETIETITIQMGGEVKQ